VIRLPNPWVILGVLTALAGAYAYGHHKGWGERDAEMQAEIALKNEEARAKEQEMAKAVAVKDEELRKANTDVAKKQTDLNRLIAAGRVRLPAPSCVQASTSATPAAGNSPEAASESDRETLRLIAEIAADGDRAINQLNACIAAYEEVREKINGQR
jgi:hypothetical protein